MVVKLDGIDPRTVGNDGDEQGVRPAVPLPRSGIPVWALAGIAVLAAVLLFVVLDARRRALIAQDHAVPRTSVALPAPPPPLAIPAAGPPQAITTVLPAPRQVQPLPAPRAIPRSNTIADPAPQPVQRFDPWMSQPAPYQPVPVPIRAPGGGAAPLVLIDTSVGSAGVAPPAAGAAVDPPSSAAPLAGVITSGRARSGAFANRSTTVSQGTLIPAVLETALDSTRAGLARAIVSRDIRSFDGTRVLIPRGSRLIGEYQGEAAAGQRRAMINWVRLIRPDGATIAIGSPASDPLGRNGVRGRLNTHFFERFGNALLQSVLSLGGSYAAAQATSGSVVVALPNTVQAGTQLVQPAQITPTLTVRAATSISIFVARDLDFTSAEQGR